MSEIVYKYLTDKNPKNQVLTGVPLADISQAQFDAMPRWIQRGVEACEFYQAVPSTSSGNGAPKTKAGAPKAPTAVVETVAKTENVED